MRSMWLRRREAEEPMRIRRAAIPAAIAAGGVVGAVARYALSATWPAAAGQFPWTTFVINVTGSACLGFLLRFIIERMPRDRFGRSVLCTGVLGAYTTFSTFALEAVLLGKDGHTVTGIAYVVASMVASLAAVVVGTLVARFTLKAERWMSEARS
jgi:fluoride exporter